MISDTRYAVGDNRILTACNKRISRSLNDSITIVTTIVCGITAFNNHRGEGGTIQKNIISNARYAIRDGDGGDGGATKESIISNTRYAVGDSDRSEGGAIIESTISNTRYAIGDNRVLTTCNKGVGSGFNNCVAILTTIVGGITTFDYHGGKGGAATESQISNAHYAVWNVDGSECGATRERRTSNARYAVANGDGGEGEAIIESMISNARYAVVDGDRGEGEAIRESTLSNARYAVGDAVVSNGFGDGGIGDR